MDLGLEIETKLTNDQGRMAGTDTFERVQNGLVQSADATSGPTTVLFWNTHRQPVLEALTALCATFQVDVLVLAESSICPEEFTGKSGVEGDSYRLVSFESTRFQTYCRCGRDVVRPVQDNKHASFFRVKPLNRQEFLLVAVHLPSKLHHDEKDLMLFCSGVVREIAKKEKDFGHDRTLVIGDLNVNPFESCLTGATCFNAVMDRQEAAKGVRTVSGDSYKYFYNPMWSFLGDMSPGPPGTFYYKSGFDCIVWHTLDQVLFRPDLLDAFDPDQSIQVLCRFPPQPGPAKARDAFWGSDHAPLLCRLFPKEIST